MYIVNAAIKFKDGEVITAKQHYQIVREASQMGITPVGAVQGFVGADSKFYTRKQALKLALESGQIQGDHEGLLYSEDLWPESILAVD